MKKTKIIKYTNILHAHGLGSKRAIAFVQNHQDDQKFQKRAKALEEVWVRYPMNNNQTPNIALVIGAVCFVVALGILSIILI